jgi:hypothetical protein
MPGLIKIGRTVRDRRTRGRELFTTGVPTPFELAFEVYSEEHQQLEDEIHNKLEDFRVNPNREFFRYPLKDAIKILDELSMKSKSSKGIFSALSIFGVLKEKYLSWISPDITDVQIVQTDERVWLEITREEEIAGYLKD